MWCARVRERVSDSVISTIRRMCTSTKLALLEEVFNHFDGVEEDGIYYADFIRFEKQCPMGRTKVDPNHLIKAAIKKEAARLGETKKWTPAEKLFSFKTLLAVHKHVFKCTYPLFFIQDFMQEHVLGGCVCVSAACDDV